MTAGGRRNLRAAVEEWLQGPESHPTLRLAFEEFLAGRYAGLAPQLRQVHAARRRFLWDDRRIRDVYGVGGIGESHTLSQAAHASAPVDQGRLLFQLTRCVRPGRALELGTNLGISAAYIGLGLEAAGHGLLTTVEVSPAKLRIARELFESLELRRIEPIEGYFDDVLPELLPQISPVALAFIDGNHERDATLRYFDLIRRHMPPGSTMVFDDIRWSEGMSEAWEAICASDRVTVAVDLGRTGIVVLT
ncbi:MAG TPA: class I SAM-dependent methyltransferase [Acidimicrobiia bacterium]|nr:class I SAM-dependent methyltransferase [Acidimicrobiia bacterium]